VFKFLHFCCLVYLLASGFAGKVIPFPSGTLAP
jgi:hypothetical protein